MGSVEANGREAHYEPGYFLSDKVRGVEADGIRGLLKHEGPGIVSFLAGKPNPVAFPFASITLNLKDPLPSSSPSDALASLPRQVELSGTDLENALQYGPTPGLLKLRTWLESLQEGVHKRKRDEKSMTGSGGWSVTLGSGSQDLMYKGFAAVLNPGDPVLLETPLYAGVMPALRNAKADMIEVGVDDQGLSAESMEKILSTWPEGKKRPKVVYTTPTGCNPSGCSASVERKLAVLEVCKKYGVLVFEDDPYYYLTYPRIPSYFELETQVFPDAGHVIRFDSFSKIMSAGMRLGYATGPKEICNAIDVQTSGANLHTSGVSQGVALALLTHWGPENFLDHCRSVAEFYAARRDRFEALAHKHLDGLATWVSPVAGMFLWMDLSPAGVTDSFKLIREEMLANGVLAVPGQAFFPSGRAVPYMRLSFSLVDLEEEAEEGFRRLAGAIRAWRKESGLE